MTIKSKSLANQSTETSAAEHLSCLMDRARLAGDIALYTDLQSQQGDLLFSQYRASRKVS